MIQSGKVRSYIPELNFLSNQTWHRFDLDTLKWVCIKIEIDCTRESDLFGGKISNTWKKDTRQKDPIRLYENKARPNCLKVELFLWENGIYF